MKSKFTTAAGISPCRFFRLKIVLFCKLLLTKCGKSGIIMYYSERILNFLLSLLPEAEGGKMKRREINHSARKYLTSGVLVRALCLLICVMVVAVSLVGCTSYASSEDMAALSADLDDALSEIDAIKKSYNTAQEEINKLKSENEAAQAELEMLKGNYSDSQEEISSLKTGNATAKQEIEKLKQDNQSAQDEIDDLKDSNTAAKQEIDSLKASNTSAQQEIASLKGTNTTMRQEMESLKSDNEAALQEIEKLKAQIEELQNGTTPDDPVEKIKIYIDQGHNPTSYPNSGATGNGLYEQDLTYTIGILLAELLEADGRFEVCLSRPTEDTVLGTDNDSSLDARVQGAKDFGADYFISLHINSYSDSAANGIEVYAAEQDSTSYAFGSSILQGLIDATNLRNRGMKLNSELRVLKNATMPATLLEMGFIGNSTDAALLSQSPELFAEGIYNGILAYFELSNIEAVST